MFVQALFVSHLQKSALYWLILAFRLLFYIMSYFVSTFFVFSIHTGVLRFQIFVEQFVFTFYRSQSVLGGPRVVSKFVLLPTLSRFWKIKFGLRDH